MDGRAEWNNIVFKQSCLETKDKSKYKEGEQTFKVIIGDNIWEKLSKMKKKYFRKWIYQSTR